MSEGKDAGAGSERGGGALVPSLHDELESWVAVAIGGHPQAVREARLLVILSAVLDAGGAPAQAGLRAACDTFRRLDARAVGVSVATTTALWGPAPGEVLAAIERGQVRP